MSPEFLAGIDLGDRVPQKLTRELAETADVVVTMGSPTTSTYVPGKRYIYWDLPDPKGQPIAEVRTLLDDIARRTAALIGQGRTGDRHKIRITRVSTVPGEPRSR